MTNLEIAERIAEIIRNEPYRLFTHNCFSKSVKFKLECEKAGIPARAVACIGLTRARLFRHWFTMLALHGWGEVEGKRIETSRPLGHAGIFGIVPAYIKPIIAIWFK